MRLSTFKMPATVKRWNSLCGAVIFLERQQHSKQVGKVFKKMREKILHLIILNDSNCDGCRLKISKICEEDLEEKDPPVKKYIHLRMRKIRVLIVNLNKFLSPHGHSPISKCKFFHSNIKASTCK